MFFKLAARYVRWADWSSEWSGRIIGFVIFAQIGVMLNEVVMRYFFAAPTHWGTETLVYLYGWYVMLGGAFTLFNNQHVRMDVLYMRLDTRRKAIMDAATAVVFFVFAGMLLYTGTGHFLRSILSWERSMSAWGPVIFPARLSIPVGAGLILLQGIAQFMRNLSIIFRGTDFEYKGLSPYLQMGS